MNVFITGASGFIGSYIVKILKSEHTFYAMSRTETSDQKIREIGGIPVRCSLGAVRPEHIEGCEMVIHAAAFTKEWGNRDEFWKVTVQGTEQLLDIAKKSNIKRFIHISTEAVLFIGNDLNNINEDFPYPDKSRFLYAESKLEAEKAVLRSHQNEGFEVVVLRPRLVWGPGDTTVLPIIEDMIKSKKFMWINGGKNLTSTTHIANLVEGLRCAISHWKPGEIFFISDDEISTYKEFFTEYLGTKGISMPSKSIPKTLIRLLAVLSEGIWKIFRLKSTPPLTMLPAYMLSSNFTIDHSKATKFIKYQPIISRTKAMGDLGLLYKDDKLKGKS